MPELPAVPTSVASAETVLHETPAPQPAPPKIAAAPAAEEEVPPTFNADYLHNPKPQYPHASRRMREQGRVVLRVRVSAAGLPEEVLLRDSSGYRRLDQAALEAVRAWRFVPARRGPQQIDAWVLVPLVFSLEG